MECKAVAKVQIVYESIESVYFYLTHESKDVIKKNKYRYSKADIKHISNFDIDRYVVIDVETKNQVLKTLLQIIRAYSIPNVLDLHEFIEENGDSYGIDMNLFLTTIESKSSILMGHINVVSVGRKNELDIQLIFSSFLFYFLNNDKRYRKKKLLLLRSTI